MIKTILVEEEVVCYTKTDVLKSIAIYTQKVLSFFFVFVFSSSFQVFGEYDHTE